MPIRKIGFHRVRTFFSRFQPYTPDSPDTCPRVYTTYDVIYSGISRITLYHTKTQRVGKRQPRVPATPFTTNNVPQCLVCFIHRGVPVTVQPLQ